MGGRCTTISPMGSAHASIVGGSQIALLAPGARAGDTPQAAENSREHGSPLGVTAEKLKERIEWLEDEHEVPIALDKDKADILLTVSSIETMKYPESIVAMARLLNHAGLNWTLSSKGYEATNFGYLSGKGDIAKLMVTRIVEAAEAAVRNIDAQIALQHSVIDQQQAAIAAAEASLQFADQDRARYRKLMKTGFGTVQRAQQTEAASRERAAELRRDRAGLVADHDHRVQLRVEPLVDEHLHRDPAVGEGGRRHARRHRRRRCPRRPWSDPAGALGADTRH